MASSPRIEQQVRRLLATLDPETRTILELRHGLTEDGRRRTLTEISRLTGRSREELRRIEAEAAARLRGCLGRVDRKEILVARLSAQGFGLELFEDCSEHLRVLWAQQVFEKGLSALCAELGADRDGLGAVDCGYCLLVARREGA